MDTQDAYDRVMQNNDLKVTGAYLEALETCKALGYDTHKVVPTQVDNAFWWYSVHRKEDDKICKLIGHPRVDLSDLGREV
jgi:hypothetical protein